MNRTIYIRMLIAIAWVLAVSAFAGTQPKPKDTTGPISFSMFSAETSASNDNGKSDVAQKIKELTGVDLRIEYTVGDAQQKITVMLASGEYPDLVYAKGDIAKYVDAGALLDLSPLIDKYGPNIKSFYGSYLKRHRFSETDLGIYCLGCFGVDSVPLEPDGFQVQLAVLKEMGYPRIRTVTDFENVISAYYKKYPTINGKPTIPYSVCADGWRILISITNQAASATSKSGGVYDGEWYIDLKTNKAVIHHARPAEKEYYRWLNHLYNTGLLDPEFATQKFDTYVEKIATGRVLGISEASWGYSSAEDVLRKAGMPERTYGVFPVTLDDSFEHNSMMPGGYVPSWGVSITTACKDPVRAIKFLDWMCTDESQILRFWGVEGKQWEKDANGRRVETAAWKESKKTDPDANKLSGIGLYVYPFPQKGDGILDKTGQIYNPASAVENIVKEYPDIEKEVLAAYKIKTWMDQFKTDFPAKPWGNAWQINIPQDNIVNQLFPAIQAINWKGVLQAIVAKPGDFDKIYDAYQKELKDAGVDKLNEEFTKIIQDKVKFWNE